MKKHQVTFTIHFATINTEVNYRISHLNFKFTIHFATINTVPTLTEN